MSLAVTFILQMRRITVQVHTHKPHGDRERGVLLSFGLRLL